jgi:DNA invertase Pin-like site-specific DNA recombinase
MKKATRSRKAQRAQRFQQLSAKTRPAVETCLPAAAAGADAPPATVLRAAQYVRMSTDHQKYSIINQSAANHAYAAANGFDIVRTYADEGKSGVSMQRRDGLRGLLSDIDEGRADFSVILVYDVSRWGRFQDVDESGHYEFICKKAGIRLVYCAEQFANDGTLFSAIVKGIKRAMAAEYSRELSVKVFLGQRRIAALGYNVAASAPYGFRRLLLDSSGNPKGILPRGTHKSIHTDRTIMVLGPAAEVKTVRWIFTTYATGKMPRREIARALNRRGIKNSVGNRWTSLCVRRVLKNERYIGNNVWNQTSGKLRTKRVKNDPESWVRVEGAHQAIVDRKIFAKAQSVLRKEIRIVSLEDKLNPLRKLLRRHRRLTTGIINQAHGVPSSGSYRRWFGSLHAAYRLVDFVPPRRQPSAYQTGVIAAQRLSNERLLECLRQLLLTRGFLNELVVNQSADLPCATTYRNRFGGLHRAYELIGYVKRNKKGRRIRPPRNFTNEQLLAKLRALLAEKGRLTYELIDGDPAMPSSNTYIYRFGCLSRACELIGYDAGVRSLSDRERRRTYTDEYLLNTLRAIKKKYGALSTKIVRAAKAGPSFNTYCARFGSIARAFELVGYSPKRRQQTSRPKLVPYRKPQNARPDSKRDLLRALKKLWRKRGKLSEAIIEKSSDVPSCTLYRRRFGSLSHVYNLIGYPPSWREHRPKPRVSA